MRKSFNGLGGIVVNEVKKDLYSGDVFIFTNKRRDQIRLLVWDRDGFWVCAKRLEEGTFQIPEKLDLKENDFMLNIPLYVEKIIEDNLPSVEEALADLKTAWDTSLQAEEKCRTIIKNYI